MKEMLKEVKGRRLRVDQPSHTTDTFEGMRYRFVSVHLKDISRAHTSTISIVLSSSWATLAFTAAAMHDFPGMSVSCILWFR